MVRGWVLLLAHFDEASVTPAHLRPEGAPARPLARPETTRLQSRHLHFPVAARSRLLSGGSTMRRMLLLVPVIGTLALASGFFLLRPNPSPANPAKAEAARSNPVALPVTQVVLFSSGVGYFQREGTVEGT